MPDNRMPASNWEWIEVHSADPAASPHPKGERVVLGRKTPMGFVKFQWTGEEPEGLSEVGFAESLGAVWEDDELVTYHLDGLKHNYQHWADQFLEDSD